MAHSLSAKKRIRQNVTLRARNRARRSAIKTELRKCLETTAGANLEAAEKIFRETCQMLNRAANQGTIHRNAAARRKSRLARRLNAAKQKKAAS